MIGGCIREQKKTDPKKKSFNPARGKDLRLTTSGRMMDAILRHRHALLRAENGAAARLVAPLQQAHREIIAELAMLAARDNALGTFSNLRRERLIVMEARIRQSLAFAEMEAIGSLNRDLRALQARELEIQAALLRREIPAGISLDLVSPSPGRIDRILMQPLGGTRWGTRLHERYGGLVTEMSGALAASVQLGEGMPEAARRLNKATGIGIRSSIAMARTEIQRVANETAYESYVVNSDVVKGIVIVETLDDRTCIICAALDGTFYPLGSQPSLPPFHPLCRGFVSPVVRSLEEMGLNPTDFPPSTRASMNGQVPDSVDYESWFKTQSDEFQLDRLGPTRFQLFKNGDVTIPQFSMDLKVIPIDQLPIPT